MLCFISFLLRTPSMQRVQKGDAFTATEVPNKRRQKLQITPPMCNYANVLLTTSTLLTLKGTFVR